MCEGPGQPSQLQKDMLKEAFSTPILCLYYSYFVKRKKKKLRGAYQPLGIGDFL